MRTYLEKRKREQLFYRTYYRKIAIFSIIQMLISVLLILSAAYQIIKIPVPPYFATTADGRIINLDFESEDTNFLKDRI